MNAVLDSAMKIDNLFPMQARVSCDVFQVERELGFVTNGNLYERRFDPMSVSSRRLRKGFTNPLLKPSENIFDRRARVDRADRVTKKRDCRISRRDFDCAGNLRRFKGTLRREHFV